MAETDQQRIKAGVYGASGYAGQDVVEILSKHPCTEVVFATSNTYAGQDVPFTNLKYIPHDTAPLDQVEVVFLALPHGVSAQMAKKALDAGVRVVDLSADFRLDTPESYEKWYNHPHPHPEMLPVPYGLPEINREHLRDVKLIAAPGCYPTTTILGLYPLLKAGWLEPRSPDHRRCQVRRQRGRARPQAEPAFCRSLRQSVTLQRRACPSARRRNRAGNPEDRPECRPADFYAAPAAGGSRPDVEHLR